MSYDTRCYDLAALFLGDSPDIHNEKNIDDLAQRIQDTIESFISYKEGPCDCCGSPRGKGDHDQCVFF